MRPSPTAFLAVVLVATASAQTVVAQSTATSSAMQRTQVIVASFTKHKHVVKEKRGIRVEKYKDVRSTPAIKQNLRDYAGRYEVEDMGFVVDLQVDNSGVVTGTGYEPVGGDTGVRKTFRLVNGKIDGALLTATQIYGDGTRDRFEGLFMNRTATDSPTDPGTTIFGLGVLGRTTVVGGQTIDRYFYQRRN